jgi:ribosomal protein S18 acetylase RimI-like enzyme
VANLRTRPFVRDDIDFALVQTKREGWDTTAAVFEVCLALDPAGCFVAEADGGPAGMVTTTRYQRTAWIGNLIVAPEHRRQGIGERLMRLAMEHLAGRGVQTIRLEADPPGVPLYRRLGFTDEYESLRFARPAWQRAGHNDAERLTHTDLPEVAAFDAGHFGDERPRLLELLFGQAKAAYGVRAHSEMRGYVLVLPARQGVRVGPWVADDEQAARTLLEAVLADTADEPVAVGVPGVNKSAAALLESSGFRRSDPCLRMIRGPIAGAGQPQNIYGIANGAMG